MNRSMRFVRMAVLATTCLGMTGVTFGQKNLRDDGGANARISASLRQDAERQRQEQAKKVVEKLVRDVATPQPRPLPAPSDRGNGSMFNPRK